MKALRWMALAMLMMLILNAFCACGTLDKSELEEVLNREFEPTGYTDTSYQNYLKYYREALDVYQSKNTTAYKIESVTVNLLKAIDDLVPIADFSALREELAEEINPMLYTSASYQVYKTVYDSAVIVASNEFSNQSVVNNAVRNLKTAKNALVPKTDTSALAALLEEEYKKSDYTTSTYVYYQSAVETARALLLDDGVSASDVRLAVNGLQQAISRLVPLGDSTKLNSLLNLVRTQYLENTTAAILPEQQYTMATLDVLRNEYQKAKQKLDMHDASQAEVDAFYQSVNSAINKLVDKIDLYEAISRMDIYLPLQDKYTVASFDNYLFAVSKGMLLNEAYSATVQEIVDAVSYILDAERALVRRPMDASGRTDFDLLGGVVNCYNCSTTLGQYFSDYAQLYNAIFDSNAMIEQSDSVTFRLRDGYSVTLLSDILTITDVGRNGNDTAVTVLGVNFQMDEYAVGELLGAPSEYISTSKGASLVYVDDAASIRLEFTFVGGFMESIMIKQVM